MIKQILFLATILAICFALPIPRLTPPEATEPPRYRLDLNVDPFHRWDHIVPEFKGQLQQIARVLIDMLPIKPEDYERLKVLVESKPSYHEYLEEIKGIATIVDIPWEKLVIANLYYEFVMAPMCTSVIARDKNNKILHARNFDLWAWEALSRLSATIEVYRGNQKIAEFAQIVGTVFVQSGKNSQYSITVDARHYESGLKVALDNIFVKNYIPTMFYVRDLLQDQQLTYETAIKSIQTTNVSVPVYIAIGGTTEGSIFEKNDVGFRRQHQIDDKNWYVIVTNYDQDEDPYWDDRKSPAVKRLNAIGQAKITMQDLDTIMETFPTMNISTIYTVSMSVTENRYGLKLWYGNIHDWDKVEGKNDTWNNLDAYVADEMKTKYGSFEEYEQRVIEFREWTNKQKTILI